VRTTIAIAQKRRVSGGQRPGERRAEGGNRRGRRRDGRGPGRSAVSPA